MAQAYKRFSRYGQKAPFVNIWFAVGKEKNTIESQKDLEKGLDARGDSKQIVDGVVLDDEEIDQLVKSMILCYNESKGID